MLFICFRMRLSKRPSATMQIDETSWATMLQAEGTEGGEGTLDGGCDLVKKQTNANQR